MKITHEIRDPIHTFIKMNNDEKLILDSTYFQRLRSIHQLAMSYLVYPGATHKRFEHSLGVMELAGRVYDVITNPETIHPRVNELIPELGDANKVRYWRCVTRMAALCHDLGHLPFSHAAEADLLPEGWKHEHITADIIGALNDVWQKMTPPLRGIDVKKIAVGPAILSNINFTDWETILSELIGGDAFGVDRMDYLLRDSHHLGVAYGVFDQYRLIDTMRILPKEYEETEEPALGIEEGGLQSAEALLLARYFMFSQVYFHKTRRIYDHHLKDFLLSWLDGPTSTKISDYQILTDNEVLVALTESAQDIDSGSHEYASRIFKRNHFKLVYNRNPLDQLFTLEPGKDIARALTEKFGSDKVKHDQYYQKGASLEFPVVCKDKTYSSLALSDVLNNIPMIVIDRVYVDPQIEDDALNWLEVHRDKIIGGSEL